MDRVPMICFTVPGQPQGKGRPRIGKVGQHARIFTPAKTVAYEGLIAHEARIALDGLPMFDGPVAVELLIACQVPSSWSGKKQRQALAGEILPTTKPDADNVLRAVCDGCNGVIWRDDVLAVDGSWRKRYSAVPGLTVTVRPIAEAGGPSLSLSGLETTLNDRERVKASLCWCAC